MIEMNDKDIIECSLKIVDAIHDFCIQHNLKYSLCFGSLLGAIRHNGFIPWDDDVDIVMPRKDYEYFIENFGNDQFGVMTYSNNEKYLFPYGKVYLKGTKIVMPFRDKDQFNLGFNVDLFPLDYIDSKELFLKKKKKVKRLILKRQFAVVNCKDETNFAKKILKFLGSIPFLGKGNYYSKKIDNVYKSSLNSGKFLVHNEIYYKNAISLFNGDLFDNLIMHKFENREYCITKQYEYFLTTRYGNYMLLPPKKEQVTHHSFKAYFLDNKE